MDEVHCNYADLCPYNRGPANILGLMRSCFGTFPHIMSTSPCMNRRLKQIVHGCGTPSETWVTICGRPQFCYLFLLLLLLLFCYLVVL